MKKTIRQEGLLPDGIPRYIRMYDNGGETADRYTCVFTGRYRHLTGGEFWHLSMSTMPFHPQGIGMLGSASFQIDRPSYSHLGKKIVWTDLPPDCQRAILQNYCYLWDLSN